MMIKVRLRDTFKKLSDTGLMLCYQTPLVFGRGVVSRF